MPRGVVGRSEPPAAARLRRLYVDQDLSLQELADHYGVGKIKARSWLLGAGIPIRTHAEGGRKRQLRPPPDEELRRLCDIEGLTTPGVARHLGVSANTAGRWLAEAGLRAPRGSHKNRPRGSPRPVEPPDRAVLERLYVREQLSMEQVAAALGATRHLVRTWLLEAGIPTRPGGGQPGRPHRVPRRKTAPPPAVLASLQQQRLTRRDLAQRYDVHPSTMSAWLVGAGLPTRLPPPPATLSDQEMIDAYTAEKLTATAIARRAGVPASRVLAVLHRAGVRIDASRQAEAARRGAHQRAARPALSPADGDRAERRRREEHWSYARIAAELGVPACRVRRELAARAVPPSRNPTPGRGERIQAPVGDVRQLYVESGWPSADVGGILGFAGNVVLRTGHAHGLPIRQGGHPIVPAPVQLIDALYADKQVDAVLTAHQLPRPPAGGEIAVRFPDPVPLSRTLLADLYEGAGCSTPQIELLTGQSRAVIEARMREYGITLRAEHRSPALGRMREEARQQFLADVVARYRASGGSTAELAVHYGCAQNTVRRWLVKAGITLPGRGQWRRR